MLHRLLVASIVLVSACATDPDPRPPTLDFIVDTILTPDCGRGGCHSADARVHDLAFDSVDDTIAALETRQRNQQMVVPGSPDSSYLVTVLRDSGKVMPPDVPLSDADVALIRTWVAGGAVGFQ